VNCPEALLHISFEVGQTKSCPSVEKDGDYSDTIATNPES
jgi:hypothetical protein